MPCLRRLKAFSLIGVAPSGEVMVGGRPLAEPRHGPGRGFFLGVIAAGSRASGPEQRPLEKLDGGIWIGAL